MRVSPISMYVNQNQQHKKVMNNIATPNFKATMGGAYTEVYRSALNTTFAKSDLQSTFKPKLIEMHDALIEAALKLPEELLAIDAESIFYDAKKLGFKYYDAIARKIGLGIGQYKTLAYDSDNQSRIILGNLGPYNKGYFGVTNHDQVVLEFQDPIKPETFIGFSRDDETGIALTRLDGRHEFYDNGYDYSYKSFSTQGYKPEAYREYYDQEGESSKQTFWSWFLNL